MEAVDINLWAVLVAAVIYFFIGALWYSPLLFAKQWMSAVGKTEDELNKGGYSKFAATFLLLLLLCYVLAHMLEYTGAETASGAIVSGVWLWLGFVATTMTINALYAGRPQKLTVIDAGYHLAGMFGASLTLVLLS